MWLAVTQKAGATFGNVGAIYGIRPTVDESPQKNEIILPSGVNGIDTRSTDCTYRNRKYLVGGFTWNLLIDEDFRCHKQGIRPPPVIPTLAAGGAPGPTGSAVVCIAFYDEVTDEWSPLSGASTAVNLVNQSRVVGNIPTTALDSRVTHVGVWVSMDGLLFRLSTKRQLGVSTITENVATLALGGAFPDSFEAMPRGNINAIYNERQLIAGDALHPDVLYISGSFYPERYEGLSFQTRKGEPIVALVPLRTVCLVLTPTSSYTLRGFTNDDMRLDLADEDVGAFSQQGCCVIGGNAWVPNDQSIWMYNGAWHNMLKGNQDLWVRMYKGNNQLLFENGFAVHSRKDYTFRFYVSDIDSIYDLPEELPNPSLLSVKTIGWVADYTPTAPEVSGTFSAPNWSWDVMQRRIDSVSALALPGAKRADIYVGACDGYLRVEDDDDADDDADLYYKGMWIRTAAFFMGDPGHDNRGGKSFTDLWSYFEAETVASTCYFKAGDEAAWKQLPPDNVNHFYLHAVGAGYEETTTLTTNWELVPRTVVVHRPIQLSGRSLTAEFFVSSPLGVFWRGFGGRWRPGTALRPAAAEVEEGS